MPKVLAALSGGVDSAVCAKLLLDAGHDVIGAHMLLFDSAAPHASDARTVCDTLSIPFRALPFQAEFQRDVISYFIEAYATGLTPNPCVICNRRIKFGRLFEALADYGCDLISTGHYARRELLPGTGRAVLRKGADTQKDQSYFLAYLTPEILAKTLFPLGEYTKPQVRTLASDYALPVKSKSDSQDICFVPDGDFARFILDEGSYVPKPGQFVDKAGKVLGSHAGAFAFTKGQRRGTGVSSAGRLFVLEKDMESGKVVLGDNEELFSNELIANDINWILYDNPEQSFCCTAKTRSTGKEQAAVAHPLSDGRLRVTFSEPQRSITAGQAVVLYDGEYVICGGIIEAAM